MKLTSNTILITGGGSGIGYELTKQLTALGNTILITGRDQAKMDRAKAAFPKVHTFRSDVSDPNDESRGAWIYFETNEPIGRSHARHTQLIQSLFVARQPKTAGPHGEA